MTSSSSPPKRCLYEVLDLPRDCTHDEIRSSYRRLALQRHPDKLVKSGVPESEATSSFQELVNAYEVLSDPKERSWYDSHRNQILFSSTTAAAGGNGSGFYVPDLFSYFSNSVFSGYTDKGKGFYKVYGDLFEKIYANELNFVTKLGLPLPSKEAPVIGKLDSPYAQVTAFYNYWLGFGTVLDFFWEDKYDAMAGVNRKSRRVMEEENKKLRKKAKREYNETVRGLAEFVKKRDKRVIDMQIKRNEEMERKREEEKQRKKELERRKAERAMNYEEPEWAKVEDDYEDEEEDVEDRKNELYCVVCRKKFKSDKQWKNHEQSKKHKEKVAELREAFSEEDKEFEATEGGYQKGAEGDENDAGYMSVDEVLNESQDEFEDSVGVQGEEVDGGTADSSEVNEVADMNNISGTNGVGAEMESDNNDEANVLEAMLSGRKNRKKMANKAPAEKVQLEKDGDEMEFMEYNNTKGSRRNKGGRRRRKGEREEKEAEGTKDTDVAERNDDGEEHDRLDDEAGESSANPLPESETKERNDATVGEENPREDVKKKTRRRKDNASKSEVASRRNDEGEEQDGCDDEGGESGSNPFSEFETKVKIDDASVKGADTVREDVKKKITKKKETASKAKVTRGRKDKGSVNGSENTCEKCGAEFESRNKLHKHLGDTGHALIKSR